MRGWGTSEYRQEFGSESAKLEIAVTLAAARKTAGVTQARLAELAKVSQAYIAKLESGDANPSIRKNRPVVRLYVVEALLQFQKHQPSGFLRMGLPGGSNRHGVV